MKEKEHWYLPPGLERKMTEIARQLRRDCTPGEQILWQAIRRRQLEGKRFRRQMPIGPFIVDFYCPSEHLAIEVDGPIHDSQQEADKIRQELLESLGIRFVRVTTDQVEHNLSEVIKTIRAAFHGDSE